MKYIDSEKLTAEIERRIENYNASIENNYSKEKSIKAERDSWKWAECKWFLNLIASLQQEQPEVDLDKEIKDTCRGYRINDYHEQELGKHDIENIARHFYELGLKARKED